MELITQLAGQGLLGLLLALAIVGYVMKDRQVQSLNDKFTEVLRDNIITTQGMQKTLDALLSIINGKK